MQEDKRGRIHSTPGGRGIKGILFRPEMIRAIANGSKTQTRRVIKPQPKECTVSVVRSASPLHWQSRWPVDMRALYPNSEPTTMLGDIYKTRYQVGELVYIKEACCLACAKDDSPCICYKADIGPRWKGEVPCIEGKWCSPLFMPARVARYFIKIIDVKLQRLQEITVQDIIAEGIEPLSDSLNWVASTIDCFRQRWDSISPKLPWSSNPWVWVYSFKYKRLTLSK